MNLSQQISPYMTMVPGADQTFGQYVRELLATSKGFGGPFAGGQGSSEQSQQPKIVDGLFGKYLPQNESSYEGGSVGNPVSSQIGVGRMTDAINSQALRGAGMLGLGLLGVPTMTQRGLEGLWESAQAPGAFMDAINQANDPLGALAQAQGWAPANGSYDPWSGPAVDYSSPSYSNETETLNDNYTSSEPSGGGSTTDLSGGGGFGTGADYGNQDYGSYF